MQHRRSSHSRDHFSARASHQQSHIQKVQPPLMPFGLWRRNMKKVGEKKKMYDLSLSSAGECDAAPPPKKNIHDSQNAHHSVPGVARIYPPPPAAADQHPRVHKCLMGGVGPTCISQRRRRLRSGYPFPLLTMHHLGRSLRGVGFAGRDKRRAVLPTLVFCILFVFVFFMADTNGRFFWFTILGGSFTS